jgi:hypothetical protein
MKRRWLPLPIYYNSPLSKNETIPTHIPHKPGYMPDFYKSKNESAKPKVLHSTKNDAN